MVRTFLILLLAFCSLLVWGQELSIDEKQGAEKNVERKKRRKKDTSEVIFQPKRLEIPVEDMRDDFQVIEGYEHGLLLAQNTHEYTENGEVWHFYLVNKSLEIEWKTSRVIRQQNDLIGFDYSLGYFFLLFDKPKRYKEYELLVIDVEGQNMVNAQLSLPMILELDFFEALDNGVLLVGKYNGRPVALIHDILGNKPKVLPGFYNYNERVFELVLDEHNKTFSIVLAEKMRNGKYTNRIKSFTYDGFLIEENLLNPGEDLNLVDGTTTSFDGGLQYMAGTYSKRTSFYSQGLYISKFLNGRQKFLKKHNYGDLKNFFAYRGKKAMARIARRVERKKAKGKEPKFEYRLYIHDIIPMGEQNILVAEAYYVRYSSTATNYGSTYNPYALNTPTNDPRYGQYRNFLGYKYTHAIVVAFDSSGEILWDNSFKTNDITSYDLEKSVAVNIQGKNAAIMYLDDDEIKSKAVAGSDVIEEKRYNPIRLTKEGDKIKGRSQETQGLQNWYDNYLFSYGVQRIRNKTMPDGGKVRRVFYINKIQFAEDVEVKESEFRVSSTY